VIARASTDTLALDDPDVVAALRMIRQRACDRLRCEDVIESTAISRSTLDARFQALIGRTVHQEIFRVRLNKAMQLLRDTDCSPVEVTDRSGFRYPSQLCHLFKKHLGVTPGQFRRNARSAPVPIRAGR